MKVKSIIACGLLLLGVGAATTSCEDMFTAENTLVTTDLAPKDTLYQMMGIIQRMQKLADRTVLLGEIRADLVEVDPIHASADIQELSVNKVSLNNVYNKPADYYAVINNCNVFLTKVDSARFGQGIRRYFEKEICSSKCFRAWCYLELVKIYGEVPFITQPVLTSGQAEDILLTGQKADMKTILDFCIADLQKYPDMPENEELRQSYGNKTYAGIKYNEMMIPVRALLAELYLWRASYTNSQQDYLNAIAMYHDFFTFPREEINTGNYDVAWMDRDFHRMSDSYINYFTSASELCAGVLPMDTTTYYGNVADLAAVFNSKYSNKYYPAAIPSQRMKDISKSQDYCYYTTDGKISEIIMGSHNPNDYENKLYEGDLRLSSIYYTMSNFRESQYNSDVNPMMMVNYKYYTSTSSDRRIQYIPLFRYTTLYLHMAEALNRAGFPETAFAILAHGLSYYTMNDRSIISQDEFDRLCNIKSRGFTISEANYTGDLRAKTTGSFVIWSSDVFGTLDKNSGAATTRVQGGPKVQIGIHSLGCGDTEYNVMYNLDDSATIAGLTPYRELRPMEDLPVLTRKSTHEDSLEYQRIYDANVLADSLNKVDIAEVDAINVAYLASPAVRATRQAHVSKLILEEEAIEGMFEGLRFYDIMRYQMQEKQGAGIGKTIAMPAFITEKYGATPSMEGKPWYLPMPTR